MVSHRRKINCILSASCLLSSIFSLYILLLCFCRVDCYARDTLKQGDWITDNGTALVSSGGTFKLGFFTSNHKRFVGIWYKQDQQTVVWVSNRDSPVVNATGTFGIADDGNFKISDTTGKEYWSTDKSSSTNRTLKLMDSGNLVLSDDDDQLATSLWESFRRPTHTFLPGMKMDENLMLTSWIGDGDPGIGEFTFKQYEEEGGHYVISKQTGDYWRSWMSGKFSSTDELMPYAIAYLLSNFSKSLNQTKYPLPPKSSAQLLLDYNYTRLVMNYNGELQYLKWDADKGNWSMIWREPEDNCSIYNAFGKFGSCNISLSAAVSVSQLKIEPNCTSSRDCKDWPNSTCNRGTDGKKRCLCNGSFQWDGSNSNCTKGLVAGDYPQTSKEHSKGKMSTLTLIVMISLIEVFVLTSATIVCIYLWRRKIARRQDNRRSNERNRVLRTLDSERHLNDLMGSGEFREEDERGIDVPFFDLEGILAATDSFSDANKLGEGGYEPVYKGLFPGSQEIAVKRLSNVSRQGLQEFKNEVVLIAKLQHRNLVKLRGYCINGDEKILLYEYMPNKSLDSFIFDQKRSTCLDWEMRVNIILGIARGLLYLHHDSRLRIIHRDLKTSNILLDEEMNPKISDFGLARIIGGKETGSNTTRVVGTYGYMSPEYALDGLFSIKSDVFSFGVVLLEIISGKKNTGFYESELAMSLIGYAWRLWGEMKVLDLMDPTLPEICNADQFVKCVNVGLLCVQEDPKDRPTMSNVITMLDSEVATIPTPKQPAFVSWRGLSSKATSSSKPDTYTELTSSTVEET